MQYALVNDIKQEASLGAKGICDLCKMEVFAKCGEVRIDHWAHKPKQKCDGWWEEETEWHRAWKKLFPSEMREVVIEKEGVKHRADVRTGKGIVVEFQNSPLTEAAIYAREDFYGSDMFWILNGENFKPDLIIQKNPTYLSANLFRLGLSEISLKKNHYPYRWFKPKFCWLAEDQKIFFDFGKGHLYTIVSYDAKASGGVCLEISIDSFVEMVMEP